MYFDYSKICQNLIKDLAQRQRELISRRFGLESGSRETLESIGRDFGITRERVRQVVRDGVVKITPSLEKLQKIFNYFNQHLKSTGELRKEEILLSTLGRKKYQPHVFFLMTLGEPFQRISETDEFHSLWTLNPGAFAGAKEVVNSFYRELTEKKRPLALAEVQSALKVSPRFSEYFLEISKLIQKNPEGLFGLADWPEINPRNIRDKAFLALKRNGKPLHFRQVAKNIGPKALPQTVHNELIRDPRFVLVGRGTYALKEWGFKEGHVKDVIYGTLKKAGRSLSKGEVVAKVLEQRLVKENTILLNLANKKYFLKNPQGKYTTLS